MRTVLIRRTGHFRWHILLFLLLAIALGMASAQNDPAGAPPNSHEKRWGSGWECDRG